MPRSEMTRVTLFRTVIGACIGAVVPILIGVVKHLSGEDFDAQGALAALLGIAMFSILGGLLGYWTGMDRKRNCPQCGESMGFPSNAHVFRRTRRASPAGRIKDEDLLFETTTDSDVKYLEKHPFYICTRCDKEFLQSELERFEARDRSKDRKSPLAYLPQRRVRRK